MIVGIQPDRSIRRPALRTGVVLLFLVLLTSPTFANKADHHPGDSSGHSEYEAGYGSPHVQSHGRHYGDETHGYAGHGYGRQSYARGPHQSVSEYIHHILRFKEAMAITDEQAAKLRDIETAYRKQRIRLKADIAVANLELHQLLRDDETPLSTIEEKLRALYASKADLRLAGIKAKRQARAVLTEEQRRRMKAVHERIRSMMEGSNGHHRGFPHHGERERESSS
ncbi:MAG: periplasmic heavy metal sensor [Nitrospirae bacterium]|nr:MAG: periplasmic heavy metal sensor [Nitrospirota bacterium]